MRPLEGIRVLDLSHALSGPTCTHMLALLGADVVKVERPGVGDDFRHYTEHAGMPGMSIPFVACNSSKRSITLDLKQKRAIEIVHELAKTADCVVENFRPGVAAKLGLGFDDMRAVNPGVVYCSISGFGQTGRFKDWTAYDHIVQAMSGIMWLNGEPDGGPLKVGFPIIDTFTGYMASIGILAALHRRRETGVGEMVDVAMLDSAFSLMSTAMSTYFYSGEIRKRMGNRGFRLVATSDTYQTRDGYISIGANHQHQIEAMCRVIGCQWLIEDPRFATHKARVENYPALRQALIDIFSQLDGLVIEKQLAAAHVPVAFVRDLGQIADDPHFQERQVFFDAGPQTGEHPLRVVGPGFQLSEGGVAAGPAPKLGEHTDELLAELGYTEAQRRDLREQKVV